jgi:hypothetical protein
MVGIMTHRVAPRDVDVRRDGSERRHPDDRSSRSIDVAAAPFRFGALSAVLRRDAQSTMESSCQGVPIRVRRRDRQIAIDLLLWCIICFTLALSLGSCAQIPCAPGYPDPNWCTHGVGGIGGG